MKEDIFTYILLLKNYEICLTYNLKNKKALKFLKLSMRKHLINQIGDFE